MDFRGLITCVAMFVFSYDGYIAMQNLRRWANYKFAR